ncbi:hypothetical protein EV127DRAFT_410215 [Xylaria flabelliformis]|nr:hypothetical protein EV127DRAFT_410215 [Xylaria flabelliformis]
MDSNTAEELSTTYTNASFSVRVFFRVIRTPLEIVLSEDTGNWFWGVLGLGLFGLGLKSMSVCYQHLALETQTVSLAMSWDLDSGLVSPTTLWYQLPQLVLAVRSSDLSKWSLVGEKMEPVSQTVSCLSYVYGVPVHGFMRGSVLFRCLRAAVQGRSRTDCRKFMVFDHWVKVNYIIASQPSMRSPQPTYSVLAEFSRHLSRNVARRGIHGCIQTVKTFREMVRLSTEWLTAFVSVIL